MKKGYLCLLSLCFVGVATAQQKAGVYAPMKKYNDIASKGRKVTISQEKATVIWDDDFSVPANWTMTTDGAGTPPHTMGDWTITTNVNAGPVTALNPAGMTTAANGYALINSDAAGAGQNQNATIYENETIDLSAYPNVTVVFQETHRRYQESTYVVVSADNGVTWTEFEVNASMPANSNSTNPQMVQVNISSVAGNQSQVRIGFKYTGTFDWFWAVDDVQVVSTEDYDLEMQSEYFGTMGPWGARLPYYQIPAKQIAPIEFGGIVKNIGALAQSDIVYTASIPTASYSSSSPIGALAPDEVDTFEVATTFTPAYALDSYTVTSSVTSPNTDAAPANNTINNLTIEITSDIYARDMGDMTGGLFNQGQGYEMGNVFDIVEETEIVAIEAEIASTSVAGGEVFGTLYDPTTAEFTALANTVSHTLTTADIAAGKIILAIDGGSYLLNAGSSYLVTFGSYGVSGANDDLVLGASGISEAQTTFLYDATDNTWYYSTSTPMVRMVTLRHDLGLNENNTANLAVYPNPTSGAATVSFDLKVGADVVVTVTDLAGKVVATQRVANAVAGTHKLAIETAGLADGLYTVNFLAGENISTTKLVVKK